MEERKKKLIPNRTIGLQTKVITDGITQEQCRVCYGRGKYNVQIPSNVIRNLKGQNGFVTIENDCTSCEGGVVKSKIRIIRKNKVTAII